MVAMLLFTSALTIVAVEPLGSAWGVLASTALVAGLVLTAEGCRKFRGSPPRLLPLYLAGFLAVAGAGYFESASRPGARDQVLCAFLAGAGVLCAVTLARQRPTQTFPARATAGLFAILALMAPLGVSQYKWEKSTVTGSPRSRPYEVASLPLMCSMAGWLIAMSKRREAAAREQLLENERLAAKARADKAIAADSAKAELLLMIGHEVRNPLSGILATVELMLDTELTTEQRKDALAVYSWVETLLRMTGDILDLHQIEEGKLRIQPAPFYLRDNMEGLVKMMKPLAATKGLTLEVHFDERVPRTAVGDAGRIRQVVMNLVSNALKFTSEGGIRMAVSYGPKEGGRAELMVSVTDTGIGIAPENIATLFHRDGVAHTSTSRTHGGNGIGLVLSSKLVRLMGGSLEVESKLGEGSTFRVRVPLEAASRPNWAGR
jgi:signal transduction histidine kinase